jgi:hypothetical protein
MKDLDRRISVAPMMDWRDFGENQQSGQWLTPLNSCAWHTAGTPISNIFLAIGPIVCSDDGCSFHWRIGNLPYRLLL